MQKSWNVNRFPLSTIELLRLSRWPNASDFVVLFNILFRNMSVSKGKVVVFARIRILIDCPVILFAEIIEHILVFVYYLQFAYGGQSPTLPFAFAGTIRQYPIHPIIFIRPLDIDFVSRDFYRVFRSFGRFRFPVLILCKRKHSWENKQPTNYDFFHFIVHLHYRGINTHSLGLRSEVTLNERWPHDSSL